MNHKNYKKVDLTAKVILNDCLTAYLKTVSQLTARYDGLFTGSAKKFALPGVQYKVYDAPGVAVKAYADCDYGETSSPAPTFMKQLGSSFFAKEMLAAVDACSHRKDFELEVSTDALSSVAAGSLHVTSARVNGGAIEDGTSLLAGVANIHILPVWGVRETDDPSLEGFFSYSQHGGILRPVDGTEVRYCTNPICVFTHTESIALRINRKEAYDQVVDVLLVVDMEYLSSLLLAQCRAARQRDKDHYDYRISALKHAWDPQLTFEVPFDVTRFLCFLYKAVSDTMGSIGVGGRLFPERNAAHYCFQALSYVPYFVWDVVNTAVRFCAPYVIKRLQAEDDFILRSKPFKKPNVVLPVFSGFGNGDLRKKVGQVAQSVAALNKVNKDKG